MGRTNSEIKIPQIAQQTLSRRSVLDWLGKATVIALGSDFFAACATDGGVDESVNRDEDGTGAAGDGGRDAGISDSGTNGISFHPGDGELAIFENWGQRTVDRQDMEKILRSWTLEVNGLVEKPFSLSFADLIGLSRSDMVADFHCVEGWSIYDVPWNGVRVSELLEMAGPTPDATHVTFHTLGDVYGESLPLAVALEPTTLLAYGIMNASLPLGRGFPLRLVVPRKLAYKSAKYVYRLELDNQPRQGYWVKLGYPYDADVPPERLRS